MIRVIHYNIDPVVITTSSVYCDHKKKKQKKISSRLTNKTSNFQTKKANEKIKKRKETKNKQKKISHLDVESLA